MIGPNPKIERAARKWYERQAPKIPWHEWSAQIMQLCADCPSKRDDEHDYLYCEQCPLMGALVAILGLQARVVQIERAASSATNHEDCDS